MSKIYYDKDATLDPVQNKKIGIIGYGNQGRAQALNMRDSGLQNISIGSIKDASMEQAQADGISAGSIEEISAASDILFLLIPDEVMPKVYEQSILHGLKAGNVINFASGYNITFKKIIPPDFVDVIMVAPRMIGEGVRELFVNKKGYPAFVGVEQDASGQALEIALGLAKAMGATMKAAMEVTMQQETTMDLFAEQAIWPLIESILMEAFDYQVKMGLPSEAIVTELYMSKEPAYMFEKMADFGFWKQFLLHSHTSQYGQLSRYHQVDRTSIRSFMDKAATEIESGAFAEEWEKEQAEGMSEFNRLREEAFQHPINEIEDKLRDQS